MVRVMIATRERMKAGEPGSVMLFPTIVVATMVGAKPKMPPTM